MINYFFRINNKPGLLEAKRPFFATGNQENMSSMSTDLKGMVGSMMDIKLEMNGMENNTGMSSVNTGEMAYRFDNLNRAVNYIGYNVNQMGKPIP